VAGEATFSIVTLTPATWTSIAAARPCRVRSFGRDGGTDADAGAGQGPTKTGTNAGIISLAFAHLPAQSKTLITDCLFMPICQNNI